MFSIDVDKEVWDDFSANPVNYTKSVDNYLGRYVSFFWSFSSHLSASSRLRKEYRLFNEKLGQTGAGLRFEDVEEGSTLSNLIGSFPCFLPWPTLIVVFPRTTRTGFPVLEASPWFLANAPQFQPTYSFVRAWTGSCC